MKRLFVLAVVLAGATVMADAAGDYLKARRRLVNREIVGDVAIYTYVQGTRTWTETNAVRRVAVRPAPERYSKLKLIRVAKAAGKWESLKSAISAMGMEDEWQACQHIQSDDPAYIAATNAVVVRGIATEADVRAFMLQAAE